MKILFLSFFIMLLLNFSWCQDYDPSSCDWENNSDECFALAQAEFDREKAALDVEIAALEKQNDDVTAEINAEMEIVNQKVIDLKQQMDNFQKEMDESFKNMTPSDLYDELEKDLATLNDNSN